MGADPGASAAVAQDAVVFAGIAGKDLHAVETRDAVAVGVEQEKSVLGADDEAGRAVRGAGGNDGAERLQFGQQVLEQLKAALARIEVAQMVDEVAHEQAFVGEREGKAHVAVDEAQAVVGGVARESAVLVAHQAQLCADPDAPVAVAADVGAVDDVAEERARHRLPLRVEEINPPASGQQQGVSVDGGAASHQVALNGAHETGEGRARVDVEQSARLHAQPQSSLMVDGAGLEPFPLQRRAGHQRVEQGAQRVQCRHSCVGERVAVFADEALQGLAACKAVVVVAEALEAQVVEIERIEVLEPQERVALQKMAVASDHRQRTHAVEAAGLLHKFASVVERKGALCGDKDASVGQRHDLSHLVVVKAVICSEMAQIGLCGSREAHAGENDGEQDAFHGGIICFSGTKI